MKAISPEAIYRAKAKRRKQLAALPLEEKVRIMEKLQVMGHQMREARAKFLAASNLPPEPS